MSVVEVDPTGPTQATGLVVGAWLLLLVFGGVSGVALGALGRRLRLRRLYAACLVLVLWLAAGVTGLVFASMGRRQLDTHHPALAEVFTPQLTGALNLLALVGGLVFAVYLWHQRARRDY